MLIIVKCIIKKTLEKGRSKNHMSGKNIACHKICNLTNVVRISMLIQL